MHPWQVFERDHVWHPYASMTSPMPAYPVKSASGVLLELENGERLIDGMSSWWSAIHGYNVPELNSAITSQLENMAHVMFGGLTHQPAATLAAKLLEIAPSNMNHVFFSDSGSVSVEVAMKMAMQYWQALGKQRKQRLLTIRHGYHGDTFAAMSVCDPDAGMHHLFSGVLPQHFFADAPTVADDEAWSETHIQSFQNLIAQHHHDVAAVILEPIVQGAGGMRIYAPEFLRQVRRLCNQYDVLLILDEIATGFGRTGEMFACEHAGIQPDIMCMGKALTGGYMSLAATLCSAKVCDGMHTDDTAVLMHGPTFMANPLACSVAIASLDLLQKTPWKQRVTMIEKHLLDALSPCKNSEKVTDVRVKGAIGVIEMKERVDVAEVQAKLVAKGVWLRPFGKLVYTMPPYMIPKHALTQLTNAMCKLCA
ncbi:MAG: adenosylmethionine--8-amino-7-oxononanoate transaminase [Mariprofundaceae bacterium]